MHVVHLTGRFSSVCLSLSGLIDCNEIAGDNLESSLN